MALIGGRGFHELAEPLDAGEHDGERLGAALASLIPALRAEPG
jgi:hypothetical protein